MKTAELLVGGIVRVALELAILRGDLRMDNGATFEEMSESEREDVISDTWNAMNGEGTCDDSPVKELTAIYAAMSIPVPTPLDRERSEGLYLKFSEPLMEPHTPVIIERVNGNCTVSQFIIARDEAHGLIDQLRDFLACSPRKVGEDATMAIVHLAHEIQEQHRAVGPEPTTYPCQVACKCGAQIEAISRDALTVVFVNHIVMEALARSSSVPAGEQQPKVVCLCGSTRFYEMFQKANYDETMLGNIVLSVGFYPHAQKEMHHEEAGCTPEQKIGLDELHKRKIDLADEVFVLNVGGYIGSSTRGEIDYAEAHNKPVRYLEALGEQKQEDGV